MLSVEIANASRRLDPSADSLQGRSRNSARSGAVESRCQLRCAKKGGPGYAAAKARHFRKAILKRSARL